MTACQIERSPCVEMWIFLHRIQYLKLRFTYTQNNYQEKFALTQTILYIKGWFCVTINF